MEEEIPKNMFYSGFAASVVKEEDSDMYDYIGGSPTIMGTQKWPICGEHGPLMFLWQSKDINTPEQLIQCFVCATIERGFDGNNISFNRDCKTRGKHFIPTDCHIGDENQKWAYLIRKFIIEKDEELINPVSKGPKWPKSYIKWNCIDLIKPKNMLRKEFGFDYNDYTVDGAKIHTDIIETYRNDEKRKLLSKYVLFHHTYGLYEQHKVPEQFGYFQMIDKYGTAALPTFNSGNGGMFNISEDLIMYYST